MVELFTFNNILPKNFNWSRLAHDNPDYIFKMTDFRKVTNDVIELLNDKDVENIVINAHGRIAVETPLIILPDTMQIKNFSNFGLPNNTEIFGIYSEYYRILVKNLKAYELKKYREMGFGDKIGKFSDRDLFKLVKKYNYNPEVKFIKQPSLLFAIDELYGDKYRDDEDFYFIKQYVLLVQQNLGIDNKYNIFNYPEQYNLMFRNDKNTLFKENSLFPNFRLSSVSQKSDIIPRLHDEYIYLRLIYKQHWKFTDIVFKDIRAIELIYVLNYISKHRKSRCTVGIMSCASFYDKERILNDPIWLIDNCLGYLDLNIKEKNKLRRRGSLLTRIKHLGRVIENINKKQRRFDNLETFQQSKLEYILGNINCKTLIFNFIRIFPEININNSKEERRKYLNSVYDEATDKYKLNVDDPNDRNLTVMIWYYQFRQYLEKYDSTKPFLLDPKEYSTRNYMDSLDNESEMNSSSSEDSSSEMSSFGKKRKLLQRELSQKVQNYLKEHIIYFEHNVPCLFVTLWMNRLCIRERDSYFMFDFKKILELSNKYCNIKTDTRTFNENCKIRAMVRFLLLIKEKERKEKDCKKIIKQFNPKIFDFLKTSAQFF